MNMEWYWSLKKFLGKYWLTVLIVFIILFSIAIPVHLLKTPPESQIPKNLADHMFTFLDEWASAGAPVFTFLGIIVALYMAFRSLRLTRDIQQREHLERLVAHIREWAIDVIVENFGGEVPIVPSGGGTLYKQQDAANRLLKCQELSVKGKEYIHPIASSLSEELFDKNFSNDIMSVVNILEAIRGKIKERGQDVDNPEINKQLKDLDSQLWILTGAVIKQTAGYTTRQLASS